jgi:glucosamine-6-phosphate deaminase
MLAGEIADGIESARRAGRAYVLGCPGGRTPQTVYRSLAEVIAERALELDHVIIAMMDDYAEMDEQGGFRPVDVRAHYSCVRFGRVEIVGVLNAGAVSSVIADQNLWGPDPSNPAAYDTRLAEAGGIDLFILASGASDGHVAFNPPLSTRDSRTRVVELALTTRTDNLATFPQFDSIDDVPLYGVTVGIDTITSQARRAVMLVLGEHKQLAFAKISGASNYDPSWPATVIAVCNEPSIYADASAARGGSDVPALVRSSE